MAHAKEVEKAKKDFMDAGQNLDKAGSNLLQALLDNRLEFDLMDRELAEISKALSAESFKLNK